MTDKPAGTGKRIELTIRALILGCVLAAVFTAANTYLGLKVGLTFASAIPAAVISMALLRAFRGSTIWENMMDIYGMEPTTMPQAPLGWWHWPKRLPKRG